MQAVLPLLGTTSRRGDPFAQPGVARQRLRQHDHAGAVLDPEFAADNQLQVELPGGLVGANDASQ